MEQVLVTVTCHLSGAHSVGLGPQDSHWTLDVQSWSPLHGRWEGLYIYPTTVTVARVQK